MTELQKSSDRISILIADDHPVFREGLRKLIELQPDMAVVGEAADGEQTIKSVLQDHPDLVLLDLAMPKGGLGLVNELSRMRVSTKMIILTAQIGPSEFVEALRCGAFGVVVKDTATDMLFKAIRSVAAGEYWVRRISVPQLIEALRNTKETAPGSSQKNFGLTPRETQIIAAILAGCTNQAIAEKFDISEQTVKNHLTAIFNKTGVSNRLELALFAAKHHLVEE